MGAVQALEAPATLSVPMGSRRGKRSQEHPPPCWSWLLDGFVPLGWGGTEATGFGHRALGSPNSLHFALVYVASALFSSRWTHEDQSEVVADTTENWVWVVKEAGSWAEPTARLLEAQTTLLALSGYSSAAWPPSTLCSAGRT